MFQARYHLVCLLLLLLAPAVAMGAWHVATDGDDLGAGTAADPFLTVARAITAAASGDTILIHDGTYTGPDNRDLDPLGKGLTFRSLSGDPALCVLDAELTVGGTGCVFHPSLAGGALVFEGLTLRNAVFAGISTLPTGMAVTVRDGRFEDCGTGVMNAGPDVAEGCVFSGCGTGLSVWNEAIWLYHSATVTNCAFENCGLGFDGGHNDSDGTFTTCTFTGNDTGATASFECRLNFTDCSFTDNAVGVSGAGLATFTNCDLTGHTDHAVNVFGNYSQSGVVMHGCLVHDNPGAGIRCWGLEFELVDTFVLNSGGYGVVVPDAWGILVSGSVVAGNAGDGMELNYTDGGLSWLSFLVERTTVAYNGTGIVMTGPGLAVANTLVAFNTGEALADPGATYTTCDVHGNGPDLQPDSWVVGVDGNLDLDPLFCEPPADDYHVGGRSPCTDDYGDPVIGALGVGCDDAIAVDDIALLARWTDRGVEVAWQGRTGVLAGGAALVRRDETTGRRDVLARWEAGAFPGSGRHLDAAARPWRTYTYALEAAGDHGGGADVRLAPRADLPAASALTGVYPNPSNPRATIAFVLARDEQVTIEVYDLAGRRVDRRVLGVMTAGPQTFAWDGRDAAGQGVAAGSYVVRLVTPSVTETAGLTVVR